MKRSLTVGLTQLARIFVRKRFATIGLSHSWVVVASFSPVHSYQDRNKVDMVPKSKR